ncbi:hypothetical protein [Streptomyces albus]|uniref:hypothetical protein n=1 Tax=Streptomyces albus TaxID=1888 RepID=UPI0024E0711B|nr:hypothetical protein [Streptomyces albus]GHJ24443.1 hypothetical protein TPA0909_60570 [Streptomyces albus]
MDRIGVPAGALTRYEPQPCDTCNGNKGAVETTWGADGTRFDTWRECSACNGAGVR